MSRWLSGLQPWGAFLMRLVLGISMAYHGWDKVIPARGLRSHDLLSALHHYCGYVASLGLPYWMGYVSALTEFLGGILLVVGLFTRFAALMVAGNMLVALFYVNRHQGYSGSQYTLALIALAFMILFYGAGAASMDRRMGLA
jgi:putative oxidoreductase